MIEKPRARLVPAPFTHPRQSFDRPSTRPVADTAAPPDGVARSRSTSVLRPSVVFYFFPDGWRGGGLA